MRELFFNLAAKPEKSSGRMFSEKPCPLRTVFQRDRDRIIHSKAFRRLKFKSQVFFANTNDLYRTRLTHTIEVSQIARTIAFNLGLNLDLCEAIALSHDLGHPPFGHTGEEVLNELMLGVGGFNHNLQTLKIVTRLERQYSSFYGLNLTCETLEGIFKHNGPFDCEKEISNMLETEINFIGDPGIHPTLESQVASIADDIAYCSHDIFDAYESEILTLADLRSSPFFSDFLVEKNEQEKNVPEEIMVAQACRDLIKELVNDVIEETKNKLNLFNREPISDKALYEKPKVSFSIDTNLKVNNLKKFLFDNFYRSSVINVMRKKGEEVIIKLFDHYTKNHNSLPEKLTKNPHYFSFSDFECRKLNLVADFISGMTDKYALDIYEKIRN